LANKLFYIIERFILKLFIMKKPAVIILLATLYLLFFHATPYLAVPDWVIIALFFLSPVVVIYMVYVVLKFGKPSKYTFEERFYDDIDYERSKD